MEAEEASWRPPQPYASGADKAVPLRNRVLSLPIFTRLAESMTEFVFNGGGLILPTVMEGGGVEMLAGGVVLFIRFRKEAMFCLLSLLLV